MAKKSTLKILIAYENLGAAVRARKVSERVAARLNFNLDFRTDLYNFDFLDHPEVREEAAIRAAMADLIIIATEAPGALPGQVKSWMEEWLPCRRKGQTALVALLGREENKSWGSNGTRIYLETMARRGQMDFFCQTDRPTDRHRPEIQLPPRPCTRIESDGPVFSETAGDARWHGWGLNE